MAIPAPMPPGGSGTRLQVFVIVRHCSAFRSVERGNLFGLVHGGCFRPQHPWHEQGPEGVWGVKPNQGKLSEGVRLVDLPCTQPPTKSYWIAITQRHITPKREGLGCGGDESKLSSFCMSISEESVSF